MKIAQEDYEEFKNIIVNFSLVNISIMFNRPYILPCISLKNVSLRNYRTL